MTIHKKLIFSAFLLMSLFFNNHLVYAHDPDKILQETTLTLDPPQILIHYETSFGAILEKIQIIQNDTNKDGQFSPEEQNKFLQSMLKDLQSHFAINIDGLHINPAYINGQVDTTSIPQHMLLKLNFALSTEHLKDGAHTLTFIDQNFVDTVLQDMIYQVQAKKGSQTVTAIKDRRVLTWNFLLQKNLPGDPEINTQDQVQTKESKETLEKNRLTNIISEKKLSLWFIIIALIIATGMGALHALSPGHGKTMVAAYLVGEKGTIRDAITLGSIVTLTHVSSVIIIGVIALILSEFILPQQLYPWLGVVSGVLILIVGCWTLAKRTIYKKNPHYHSHDGHGHSHTGDHGHDHDHSHNHDSDKHHHHHGHVHSHLPTTDKISLSNLLFLGISGGLVPCPTALVVLLAAVAMHRIAFGLALIFAFSFGLASVLIIVGILVVKYSKLLMPANKEIKNVPILSSIIIILIGFGLLFNSLVSAGVINY